MDTETTLQTAARLSVAPMMDWTDRHCRYLHRAISRRALLYTEMVTSAALVRGNAAELLRHDPAEHPVALQLGGSDPKELAAAARIGADAGFDEINLNVGCPSDRVQSGCFGAVLMTRPGLVAECVSEMAAASPAEVTVKCRIGVDQQEPADVLPDFLERMRTAGVRRIAVHARKAWLEGLSPKENRTVPPLDYGLVADMVRAFPDLSLSINGGIESLDEAEGFLRRGFAGAMVGRAAYHQPMQVLAAADRRVWGGNVPDSDASEVIGRMIPYIEHHLASGGRLHSVTRHMLGLFAGRPGARAWRQILSREAPRPGAGPDVVRAALAAVEGARDEEAASAAPEHASGRASIASVPR